MEKQLPGTNQQVEEAPQPRGAELPPLEQSTHLGSQPPMAQLRHPNPEASVFLGSCSVSLPGAVLFHVTNIP